MTKVLVTGANGFTGRFVVKALAARGKEVHALVRKPGAVIDGAVSSHACDLADATALGAAIKAIAPDRVVHLAAIAFVAHGDVDEMYRTNIVGTRNLLEALSRQGSPGSVIAASSANIYGKACSGIIDEATPADPANDYGITKLTVEHLAKLYSDRLPITVTRPFNYTGVGQAADYLVPKIVDHVRRRAPRMEIGNINVERDFADVRTVAEIYARLDDAPNTSGHTYNICSGQAVSLRYIIDTACQLAGHTMEIAINPEFMRANEVRFLCGNPARLEAAIGPVDMPPLEATLRWMLEA